MNKSKIKTILIALLLASTANSAWALEVVDDIYQIGSTQDWTEFCNIHNGSTGQTAAKVSPPTKRGNHLLGRLGRICNPAAPNISICDAKDTTLLFQTINQ